MKTAQKAYLGLGSNLNHPKQQIQKALQLIDAHPDISLIESAPCYQTPAWGVENQPDFINSAAHIHTTLTPRALLKALKHIEYHDMGRTANARWHERVIDIDILLYQNVTMDTEELTIPHPLISQRWFVILPLMDLQPTLPEGLATAIDRFIQANPKPKAIQRV